MAETPIVAPDNQAPIAPPAIPEGFTLVPPEPSAMAAPAEAAPAEAAPAPTGAGEPPPIPEGFQLSSEYYSTPLETLKTVGEAGGRGLFGPAFTAAEIAAGVPKEHILGREEAHPILSPTTEAATLILPAIVSAGASAEARAGLEAASRFTLSGLLGATEKVAEKAAIQTLGRKTLTGMVGAGAAKGIVSGALLAGSDEASKMLLNDPNTSAESAAVAIGGTALVGGVIGGAFGAVPALWKASHGTKLGQEIANFKGESQFLMAEDPIKAGTAQMQNLVDTLEKHRVYGETGIKAQAIAENLPDIGLEHLEQNLKIQDAGKKILADLQKFKNPNVERFADKLTELNDMLSTTDSKTAFDELNRFKQSLSGDARWRANLDLLDMGTREYTQKARDFYFVVRDALEDSNVWGKAGELQKGINRANAGAKDTVAKIKTLFGDTIDMPDGSKQWVANPEKFARFADQLDKGKGFVQRLRTENGIEAAQNFLKEADNLYNAAGMPNPFPPVSLSTVDHILETPSTGAKMARFMYSKMLSDAGATALAGIVGAKAGKLIGVSPELTAILGTYSLGPLFRSTLPGIAKSFITNTDVSGAGAKAAMDYAASVAKGVKLMDLAAKRLFVEGADIVSKQYLPTDKDRAKLQDAVLKMQTSPEKALDNASDLSHYLPDHASSTSFLAAKIASVLNESRPNTAKGAPLDATPVVTPAQQAKLNNILNLAHQPLIALQKAQAGTLTSDDMNIIQQMYPGLVPVLRSKVFDKLTTHISKGNKISYKTQQGLSTFLGQPLNSTMKPASIQAAQMANTKGQAQQPGGMPGAAQPARSQGVKSSPALQKMPNMYKTPGQSRNIRMLKD